MTEANYSDEDFKRRREDMCPIPRIGDVPHMSVELMDSDAPPTGAGETAIVSAAGAIANAVRDATGIRPSRFPLRQEALRAGES